MSFSFGILINKVIKRLAVVVVSFLTAGPAAAALGNAGFTVNPDVAAVFFVGLFESLRNLLKNKFNVKFL